MQASRSTSAGYEPENYTSDTSPIFTAKSSFTSVRFPSNKTFLDKRTVLCKYQRKTQATKQHTLMFQVTEYILGYVREAQVSY